MFMLAAQAVKGALSIPVLANGNVRNLADAEACLAYTGAPGAIFITVCLPQNASGCAREFLWHYYIQVTIRGNAALN